jgi:hypothetical protein
MEDWRLDLIDHWDERHATTDRDAADAERQGGGRRLANP